MRKLNPFRLAIGVVLIVLGAVWFLQGIGVFKGSVMTGATLWVIVGAVVFVAGLLVIFRPGRRRLP